MKIKWVSKNKSGNIFIENLIGEGIVWQSEDPTWQGSAYMFKSKGTRHSSSKVTTIAAVDVEKIEGIRNVVTAIVTDNRLNQGLQYLQEQHLEASSANLGVFIKWVVGDSIKEESDTIITAGVDIKVFSKYAANHARQWFFNQIQ